MATARIAATALCLVAGCQPTASIGATAGEAGTGTTQGSGTAIASDTGTTTTATTATTSFDAGDVTSSTTDLGDVTDGSGSTDGLSDSTTGGLEPACFPAPFDVPCIGCAKHECCEAFAACAADFHCSCTLGCLQYAGPFGCMCPPSALAGLLFECMMPTCNPACEPP